MRKVNKNYFIRPASLLSSRMRYNKAIRKVIIAGGWISTASKLYSAKSVKKLLHTIYNGKCAYCEQIPIGGPLQVEHFRPKDGINGSSHSGYYWLAYEWSNLLLSCENCNTTKGNHFPLLDERDRVLTPTLISSGLIDESRNFILVNPIRCEKPKLINPEIINPQDHLIFSPDGEVLFLTPEGEESRLRYGLNREELYVNGRKRIKEEIELKLLKRLERYQNGRNAKYVFTEIIDIINEDIIKPIKENLSFSEFYKQMLLHFEEYFKIGDKRSANLLRFSYLQVIKNL